jgi:hypothetical protein
MAEGQEAYLLHTSTNSAAPSGIPWTPRRVRRPRSASASDRRERDALVVLTAVTSRSTGIRVAGFTGSDPNQGVAAAVNW